MAEITINDVKYTNVPNKKAGTKFASALTQSNIGVSQSVADYMNSAYFYTLVNAVDINWNGIEVAANSYINTTSDLIKFILSVSNNVDLSDYATMSYVNEKISDVIGAAPETLDTLEELAYALSYNASLSYVQEALSGKANVGDVYTKNEVDTAIQNISLTPGPAGQDGQDGAAGADGKSAYELAVDEGYEGTLSQWLESLHGQDGNDGVAGADGNDGLSAYQIAVNNGFEGDETAWLASLKGDTGEVDYSRLNSYVSYTAANSYYITLDTNQTITGAKTLTNWLYMNRDESSLTFNNSDITTLAQIYTKYKWKYYGSSRMNLMKIGTFSSTYLALSNGGILLLMPMASNISDANIPSFGGEIYMPLGFKDSNNNIITASYNGLVDLSSIGGGGTADLSNYVSYTQANSYYMTVEGTKQIINSPKTFVGNKRINFRQGTSTDKLGFTLYNSDEKEVGGFEWRTDTINGKPLLSLQHYVGTGNVSIIEQSYLGFRQTQGNNKYHLLAPIPADVNTIETINVGNDYRNFFFPLVFKNGSNKVYTDCTGLVDMASLIPSAPDLSGYVSYTQANSYYAATNHTHDLSGYVSYTQANSYYAAKDDIPTMPDMSSYVSLTSYNALAARVEELASWIASYHSSYTPTPSGTDPDIYFMNPTMTVDYTMSASMVDGGAMAYPQYLSGSNSTDGAWITWSSSDTTVATVAHGGCITAQGNGTTNISAEYTAHDTYNYKKVEYALTITNYNSSIEPVDNSFYFMDSNRTLYNSGMDSLYINNYTGIDTMTYPIQWSSSNANITVDQNGVVSWTMTGETATITATLSDGTNTHTATCTVTTAVNKTSPYGNWYENGNSVYQLVLVEGAMDAHDLTFDGTPGDSWTFSGSGELPSGISVDSSTGEITVSALSSATVGDYYITGNRMEDSTYWSGMSSFTIKVLPSGSNPQFYYEQQSVYLDNSAMQTQSPMLHNEYAGMGYDVTYSSADTSVATVDAYGMISFAGAGNTTVTATLSNGGNTIATATISVYCTSMSA